MRDFFSGFAYDEEQRRRLRQHQAFHGRSGGVGDPIAALLGTSELYAPLTHSLILTRGTGDPTFTRATSAWEFDNEGKLILVPSGSARFGGARMVHNKVPTSEDFSSASWTKTNVTCSGAAINAINAPNGTLTADKIEESVTGSAVSHSVTFASTIAYGGETYLLKFYAKSGERNRLRVWMRGGSSGNRFEYRINLGTAAVEYSANVGNFTNGSVTITAAADGWYEIISKCTTGAGESSIAAIISILDDVSTGDYIGTVGNGLYLWGAQLENVTGQADQTASKYVSAGVLSAPFHGAGVDGVKWFNTNKDGSTISESSLLGYHPEGAGTNSLLYSRDLTNAAWVKTNVTAVKTATGIDNAPDSASTLTASAADATILQTLTLAAAARSFSAYVKRRTGSGSVYITRDGGTNWTDITSSLGASWTRVKIKNTSVLNPSVGFKIATSGDAIDVDVCQDEAGASISSPIITTTAAVTRNADAETFQTASNWSDTAGWALATVQCESWANATGTAIGNGTNGLKLSASNSGIVAYDGTNTVNGPAGSPSGAEKLAMTWGSGALQAASGGVAGSAGSYDGAWGLATVGIGTSQGNVYIKDVYIGQSALTAAQLVQVTA